MKKILLFFLPLLLNGAEMIRIEGEHLTGWGVCTLQGVVTAGHLLFQDSTWHCENGEPEWVIADTERDLVCLQSDEAAGHPAKIVFPPGELSQGSVVRSDQNSVVVRGLNTRQGDSGRPLVNAAGEVYAVIIARQMRDDTVYTLGARIDRPITGKRIPIKEFRSWNIRYAKLHSILEKLKKLPGSEDDGTVRDRAAVLLKHTPVENSSTARTLNAKHQETLKEVARIAVWLGLTPYGERMYRKEAYTDKRWQECSKNAALLLNGEKWSLAGFCSPQKEWKWFACCQEGPFAGSIMAFDK